MNTFDESFHCPFCSERFEFCGCQNDDSDEPEFLFRPVCEECGYSTRGLFYFAGDSTGRCDYCHNGKRASYNTYAEPDWY